MCFTIRLNCVAHMKGMTSQKNGQINDKFSKRKTRAIDHSKLLMKKKLKKCVHIHSLESWVHPSIQTIHSSSTRNIHTMKWIIIIHFFTNLFLQTTFYKGAKLIISSIHQCCTNNWLIVNNHWNNIELKDTIKMAHSCPLPENGKFYFGGGLECF